jgi:hypothetical protein
VNGDAVYRSSCDSHVCTPVGVEVALVERRLFVRPAVPRGDGVELALVGFGVAALELPRQHHHHLSHHLLQRVGLGVEGVLDRVRHADGGFVVRVEDWTRQAASACRTDALKDELELEEGGLLRDWEGKRKGKRKGRCELLLLRLLTAATLD